MKSPILRHRLILASGLLLAGFAAGCTTVVPASPPSREIVADDDHGLLFGRIHLAQTGGNTSAGLQWPIYMNWWIEEENRGSRILLTRLLFDEPFVVKLRPGSYRVRDISFRSSRGVWHASLPTAFRVHSKECISLGTWELQVQTEHVAGLMTQTVSPKSVLAPDVMEETLEFMGCPSLIDPPDSGVKRSVKLYLRPRGADRY